MCGEHQVHLLGFLCQLGGNVLLMLSLRQIFHRFLLKGKNPPTGAFGSALLWGAAAFLGSHRLCLGCHVILSGFTP